MPSLLITGASRGIGLEFCKQYAALGWRVFASCRQPGQAHELQALAKKHSNISIHRLDVSDFQQIDNLALELHSESIDILLNNAGIYGDQTDNDFGMIDYDTWIETLRINTLAPVKLAEAFLPHVSKSQRKLIVAISSLMGSMADNGSGGRILYRSSKAGLNAAMKSLAIDLYAQQIAVLILHPGWVRTDMGGNDATSSVEESINGMRTVIGSFTLEKTGSFLNFKGQELPW